MDNKEILLLADQLHATKEAKAEVDKRSKELGAKIEELDRALSDAMAEVELDNFTHSGRTFYLKSRLFASPVSGKKDVLMDALKENGFGSLVVETVNMGNQMGTGIEKSSSFANREKGVCNKTECGRTAPW